MKINLIKLNGKKVGDINIDDNIFNIEPRVDLMSRVINWQLSKRRVGSHSVLSRADISLTKSKAFKQKGTGRARRGANSVVQFRGGGVAHGPVIRSHKHKLNKKIRKLGLKSALSTKTKENNLIIIDKLDSDGKTASLKKHFDKLKINSCCVIQDGSSSSEFTKAISNIPNSKVISQIGANVYDILKYNKLLITKDAVKMLEERLIWTLAKLKICRV